jgi:hypothetical protein
MALIHRSEWLIAHPQNWFDIDQSGGGGRPTHKTRSETTSGEKSEQQQLNDAREDAGDSIPDGDEQRDESSQQDSVNPTGETTPAGGESETQQQLEAAITTLQRISAAL